MASLKVVSTNLDLPRNSSSSASSSSTSSISSLSSLLSDLHPMDDLLKSITSKSVDDVWNDILAGSTFHDAISAATTDNVDAAITDNADAAMTLEDFLTKAIRKEDVGGVPPPPPSSSSFLPFPAEGSSSSVEPFANGVSAAPSNSVQKWKRRAVEEPVDKTTLQKQRRMIKNRESAARSRERKQAHTSELEYLVHQLEQENMQLLNEEAEMRRQRKKQLFECIIPIEVMPKPKKKLRRVNSAQSL